MASAQSLLVVLKLSASPKTLNLDKPAMRGPQKKRKSDLSFIFYQNKNSPKILGIPCQQILVYFVSFKPKKYHAIPD